MIGRETMHTIQLHLQSEILQACTLAPFVLTVRVLLFFGSRKKNTLRCRPLRDRSGRMQIFVLVPHTRRPRCTRCLPVPTASTRAALYPQFPAFPSDNKTTIWPVFRSLCLSQGRRLKMLCRFKGKDEIANFLIIDQERSVCTLLYCSHSVVGIDLRIQSAYYGSISYLQTAFLDKHMSMTQKR